MAKKKVQMIELNDSMRPLQLKLECIEDGDVGLEGGEARRAVRDRVKENSLMGKYWKSLWGDKGGNS